MIGEDIQRGSTSDGKKKRRVRGGMRLTEIW